MQMKCNTTNTKPLLVNLGNLPGLLSLKKLVFTADAASVVEESRCNCVFQTSPLQTSSLCLNFPSLHHTIVSKYLLSSLRICTTLYNQLNCFAVCHCAELPWGLLVTRLCSLSLLCRHQGGRGEGASWPSYAARGGYTDWGAKSRTSKIIYVCESFSGNKVNIMIAFCTIFPQNSSNAL